MNVEQFNEESINQQSIGILKQYQIPFDPLRQLASLVLIREALERGLLETGELQEPLLLIAKLSANPELAMSLMTETDLGEEKFEMTLSETLEEAAAEILEEIVASIKARTLEPLQ
jgi:DNA mismatch repair ATPase MutS